MNRTSHRRLEGKSPMEMITGKKPDLSHLRVWGCEAFAHIDLSIRKKLDHTSTRTLLVGYNEHEKSYRLWNKAERKIIMSRNVIFNENSIGQYETGDGDYSIVIQTVDEVDQIITEPNVGISTDAPITPPTSGIDTNNSSNEGTEEIRENNSFCSDETTTNETLTMENQNGSETSNSNETDSSDPLTQNGSSFAQTKHHSTYEDIESSPDPLTNMGVTSGIFPTSSKYVVEEPRRSARIQSLNAKNTALAASGNEHCVYYQPDWKNISEAIITKDRIYAFKCSAYLIDEESMLNVNCRDPLTYKEAMSGPNKEKWNSATLKELKQLSDNGTFLVSPIPDGRKLLNSKWVYKTKHLPDGTVDKLKARLVAKGFTQVEGIDYQETFAPVIRISSIRLLLSIAASLDLEIHQVDVTGAYLYGTLDEALYMKYPEGYAGPKPPGTCLKLIKGLYGLKQAGNVWNETLKTALLSMGFTQCTADWSIYFKTLQNGRKISHGSVR